MEQNLRDGQLGGGSPDLPPPTPGYGPEGVDSGRPRQSGLTETRRLLKFTLFRRQVVTSINERR